MPVAPSAGFFIPEKKKPGRGRVFLKAPEALLLNLGFYFSFNATVDSATSVGGVVSNRTAFTVTGSAHAATVNTVLAVSYTHLTLPTKA